MYAIVKTGGKQYRVEKGQTLLVERLPDEAGAQIALEPVLYRSEDTIFDADGLKNVKVEGKVLEHVRGEKLRVFKFKPKRGYKRRTGHRQELTRIEVTDISSGKAKPAKASRAKQPAGEQEATATATEARPKATARRAKAPAKASKAAPRAAKGRTEKGKDGS